MSPISFEVLVPILYDLKKYIHTCHLVLFFWHKIRTKTLKNDIRAHNNIFCLAHGINQIIF